MIHLLFVQSKSFVDKSLTKFLFKLSLKDISIIGPDHLSDIVIDYYESDHRAVLAKFRF